MEKKLFNLSRITDNFEVGKIAIFMSVFLSCLILLVSFFPVVDAAVHYPPGSLLQPEDVTSSHIRNGTIIDEDVSATAAIAWSKLDKTGSSLADLATVAFSDTTGTVGVTRGGTGLTSCTAGDLITATGANTWNNLAKGTANQVLGMNSGATTQEYKTMTAGAGIAITHGANAITVATTGNTNTASTLTAGEALTAGNAVYVSGGADKLLNLTTGMTYSEYHYINGGNDASSAASQSFTATSTTTIRSIRVELVKVNSPTDNIIVGIQDNSSGVPDGTYNDSASLAASSVAAGKTYYWFTVNVPVTQSSVYHVVITRSGGVDTTNRIAVSYNMVGGYAGGTRCNRNNATWSTSTGDFDVVLYTFGTAGKAYKTHADFAESADGFIGFAGANISADATGSIVTSGEISGLSSLTAGAKYYLSNTSGAIATSAGTISRKACIAISATQCVITNIW